MWSNVLKACLDSSSLPWDLLDKYKEHPEDEDHFNVCKVVLNRLSAKDLVEDDKHRNILKHVLIRDHGHLFLLLLDSWTHEPASAKKVFLKDVVEEYVSRGHIVKTLLKEGNPVQLISSIVTLPDVVSNSYLGRTPSKFIDQVYFETLLKEVGKQLTCENASKFAPLVSRIACRGHGDLVYRILLRNEQKVEVIPTLMKTLPEDCLEYVLRPLFDQSLDIDHLLKIIPNNFLDRTAVRYILLKKFILISYFSVNESNVPWNLIFYLHETSVDCLFEAVRNALVAFSKRSSLKHRTPNQNLYMYSLIAVSVRFFDDFTEQQKQDLHRISKEAIEVHITDTSSESRNCCLFLGQTLLNQLDKEGPQLDFEVQDDDNISILKTFLSSRNNRPHSEPISPMTTSASKENRPLIEVIGDKADETSNLNESEYNDEDVDAAYPIKKPLYLSDCLEGLLDHENHEWRFSCLETAEELIRKDTSSAKDFAIDLTRALLNLNNDCDIPNFDSWRQRALVATCVVAQAPVARFLIDSFYSKHLSMSCRLDILDILCHSAQEVAGRRPTRETKTDDSQTRILIPEEVNSIESNWKKIVEERIERNTRKLTSHSKKISLEARVNPFGNLAGDFFFPLIERFDGKDVILDVNEYDTFIVARLIFSLGIMMDAATNTLVSRKMGRSLLRFVSSYRFHSEALIRQAVSFSLCALLTSVPRVTLLQELRPEMILMKNWLVVTSEEDSDEETRKRAIQGILLFNELLASDK